MHLQSFNFKINVFKKYQIHNELEPWGHDELEPWEHELFINDEKWSEHASLKMVPVTLVVLQFGS